MSCADTAPDHVSLTFLDRIAVLPGRLAVWRPRHLVDAGGALDPFHSKAWPEALASLEVRDELPDGFPEALPVFFGKCRQVVSEPGKRLVGAIRVYLVHDSHAGEMGAVRMARTTLRAKGQLTLPDDVRKAANLQEGDLMEVEVSDSGEVILRPLATIDRSQAWFWTPEWQAGEREATEQLRRGEGEVFQDDAEFLDALS
jgi:antitoxin PrlF